jgi:flagellar FliL protein
MAPCHIPVQQAEEQLVAKAAAAKPDDTTDDASDSLEPKESGGRRKMIIVAAAIALPAIGAGLWFSGVLPRLLGIQDAEHSTEQVGSPSYVDLPEMITNLRSSKQKPEYIKLTVRLQVMNQKDVERLKAVMPRLQDLVLTHIREMTSVELHRSVVIHRLREEIITHANLAAAPARITDVQLTLLTH